jgi:hypothetical protein
VFKPNDFYGYYKGTSGLGSPDGLGAIYWMSYSSKDKADALQLQKEINGMLRPTHHAIPETGIVEGKTCGAVEFLGSRLTSKLGMAAKTTCAAAKRGGGRPIPPMIDTSYVPPRQPPATPVNVPPSPHINTGTIPEVPTPNRVVVPTPGNTMPPDVEAEVVVKNMMAPKTVVTDAPPAKAAKVALAVGAVGAVGVMLYALKKGKK